MNIIPTTSSSQQLFSPIAVAAVGNELAISWSDGYEQYLLLNMLRQNCPCAHCAGEPDVMGKRDLLKNNSQPEKADSFLLKSYQFVGGYALQLFWMDGHSSGIYSYRYLRALKF